jgi:Predicted ATPase with chaperone activity
VPRVEYKDLAEPVPAESSAVIRARVEAARGLQTERLAKYNIFSNAQMHHAQLKKLCPLSAAAQTLLKQVFEKLSLSARSYDRVIKVARTIADLEQENTINDRHIAEAIQLRGDIGLHGQ